jgi:hypothetical protein
MNERQYQHHNIITSQQNQQKQQKQQKQRYEGGGLFRHNWLVKAAPLHLEPQSTWVTSTVTSASAAAAATATVIANATVENFGETSRTFVVKATVYDADGGQVETATSSSTTVAAGGRSDVVIVNVPVVSHAFPCPFRHAFPCPELSHLSLPCFITPFPYPSLLRLFLFLFVTPILAQCRHAFSAPFRHVDWQFCSSRVSSCCFTALFIAPSSHMSSLSF